MAKEKVILAYSGGLDTTAIIPWLKENYDYEVICCCIDCGQEEELDGLEERAKYSGATKLYIEDITDEFCDDYIVPCVQGSAVYENKYLLGTSMARPGIAKRLVEIAKKALLLSATVLQVKVMTRFVLSLVSKLLLLTLRLLLHGEMTNGIWTAANQKSNTVRHTVLTFHFQQTRVTVVTETYGISAMKV
jgi:hypothetical protein